MGVKIITTVRCISNRNGKLPLTVGKKYSILSSNCLVDSKHYLIFNDDNFGGKYNKDLFEIVSVVTRENTGFEIKCNDCSTTLTYKEIIDSNGCCPKCNQKFV